MYCWKEWGKGGVWILVLKLKEFIVYDNISKFQIGMHKNDPSSTSILLAFNY